jgi:adenylylsulfate kinase-like enzyme
VPGVLTPESDRHRVPVLWLCGPSGVGKTTVAWQVYQDLARSGAHVGYVDIDQLGMCFPEPPTDPGRHRLQATNLDTVVTAFAAAGAHCVVVSGVVHPTDGVYRELTPHAALTICRLRADARELERRLIERHGAPAVVADALAEASAMDANEIGDVCLDTTGRSIEDAVRLVREHTAGWQRSAGSPPRRDVPRSGAPASTADGPILWLCGATGVGKSTIGFESYMKTVFGRRIPGAYLDLDQIGFLSPAPPDDPANHRVKARILAGLWATFRARGAECLTMVGPADDQAAIDAYARAVPHSAMTVCRLHADRDELTRRVMTRGAGGSWAQPGDPLTGLDDAWLRDIAAAAVATADALDRAGIGDVRVDTNNRSSDESADALLSQTGWPMGPGNERNGGTNVAGAAIAPSTGYGLP